MTTVGHRRRRARDAGADAHRRSAVAAAALGRYLLVRFLLIFPTVFILVTMVFVLMRTTGDPITAALGGRLTADQLAERIHAAGYDRPIIVQYLEYLGQIFTGNFGTTLTDNRPVTEVLTTYGAATLELAFYALIVAFIVGIPLGMLAAYFRDKWPDAVLRVFAILCYATPVFFAGLLLKLVFSVWLDWLPVAGPRIDRAPSSQLQLPAEPDRHLPHRRDPHRRPRGASATCSRTPCCPALALGLLTAGIFLRLVRTNVIGTLAHRLRRRGPLARRQRVPAGAQARLPAGAHPDHHRHRPADRAAARRRGAHRDDLRVEGPRLPARRSTCRPATSSPCRASSPCSR